GAAEVVKCLVSRSTYFPPAPTRSMQPDAERRAASAIAAFIRIKVVLQPGCSKCEEAPIHPSIKHKQVRRTQRAQRIHETKSVEPRSNDGIVTRPCSIAAYAARNENFVLVSVLRAA